MRVTTFVPAVLLAVIAAPLTGQAPPVASRPATTSEVVQRVSAALYEFLAPVFASEALGKSPGPWEVVLPDSSAAWQGVREHLARAIPVRSIGDQDTTQRRLQLSAIETHGDTASAMLGHSRAYRCPDRSWRWHSEHYEIRLVRRDGRWQPAVREPRMQGSSIGCF